MEAQSSREDLQSSGVRSRIASRKAASYISPSSTCGRFGSG